MDASQDNDASDDDDQLQNVPTNCLSIYHINAQSVRHKVDSLRCETYGIDIISVVESWLGAETPNSDILIPGYAAPERRDRTLQDAGQVQHGGIITYIRNSLAFKRRSDLEHPTMEMLWLEVGSPRGKFLYGSFYRPPNSRAEYWGLLEENINHARELTNLPTYISGDFNCDVSKSPNRLESVLSHEGLHILNSEPTYYTDTSARCLDIFACSEPIRVDSTITTSPTLGDHCGLILCRKNHVVRSNEYTMKILDYKNTNWDCLNTSLVNKTWPEINVDSDLDAVAADWTNHFVTTMERFTPVKTIKIRDSDKSWITPRIKRLMQLRDRAFRRAKKFPRHHPAWRKHKELCRLKEEEVRLAKERRLDTLSKKLNRGCGDEKTWWKLAKDIYRPMSDYGSVPLEKEGVAIHDQKKKADLFNEYFCSMNTVPDPDDPIPEPEIINENAPGLSELHFNEDDVLKIIRNLKTGSATGYDGVSNIALRGTAEAIAPYLTRIFNACISHGVMPQCWKRANVTPIHKRGKTSLVSNYRPISLLSCTSREPWLSGNTLAW